MRVKKFLFLIALLPSCHTAPYLTARSEFLRASYLASEVINTPDPCRDCFYGQQIVLQWELESNEPAEIFLSLRYGNRELETVTLPVICKRGFSTYRILNDNYWCKGGILAYKADLFQAGKWITTWQNSVWAEIIQLDEDIY